MSISGITNCRTGLTLSGFFDTAGSPALYDCQELFSPVCAVQEGGTNICFVVYSHILQERMFCLRSDAAEQAFQIYYGEESSADN